MIPLSQLADPPGIESQNYGQSYLLVLFFDKASLEFDDFSSLATHDRN